jgi:hypothetical protein
MQDEFKLCDIRCNYRQLEYIGTMKYSTELNDVSKSWIIVSFIMADFSIWTKMVSSNMRH